MHSGIERPRNQAETSLAVIDAIIRDARLRRRIPVALMAARAGISRMTLNKIENGEPNTALGSYATVLFVLGLGARFIYLLERKAWLYV
jgi:transcriptional regulator with XRE-family HTH domain